MVPKGVSPEGNKAEAEALTTKAMEDVKLATLCLKYAAL